ncbi:protein PXR1-like [Phragmites australis]|uniref:protein PXR1-like n=1 Tax=Phragmites australis TaxID=29695 RepID=UPI002D7950B4|nr:protein PXR1-like [Phragmites australis]
MDLETENRLASLLLEEARRLQLEAEREGVHAYLRKPNVRHRPNSRFLTATVRGVQQANRVVEVNEMWRAREKELELESKMKDRSKDRGDSRGEKRKSDLRNQSSSPIIEQEDQEGGLGDDEIERFLHSRVKRGRGAIGSRMDEPGPYLDSSSRRQDNGPNLDIRVEEKWERRVQGPEKPSFLRSKSPDDYWRRETLDGRPSSSEPQNKKEKKMKSEKKDKRDKEKKKDKKKSKHRHHHHHKNKRRD